MRGKERPNSPTAGGSSSPPRTPSASPTRPSNLTVSGSRLFFVADEGEHGRVLGSVKKAAFHHPH
ncbi:hypothetical protein ACN28E_51800 [Archangium lansingense]|uniref:hypothetical protein n=1 Tax=Archangium lansingense TaxID=2995310 RepID=UPI003B7F1308